MDPECGTGRNPHASFAAAFATANGAAMYFHSVKGGEELLVFGLLLVIGIMIVW